MIIMPRKKDPEITEYKLKNGKKFFRLRTYIGISPETGKAIKVTRSKLKSRKEAEEVRRELKAQGPGTIRKKLETKQKKITVRDAYNAWLEVMRNDVRSSTIRRIKETWKNQIEPEFGNTYISNISPDHVQKYVNNLASKYVAYKIMANQLHRIIKYAIFRHWCDKDPFDFVIMPKKSAIASRDNTLNFYELDELKRFLDVTKKFSPMTYTYFLTVASLGCRRGEAFALNWSDIDFDKRTVKIERTVSIDENDKKTIDDVKNGIHHTVPMSDHLYTALKEYQNYCHKIGDNCPMPFHTKKGDYMWSSQSDTWIRAIYRYDANQCKEWNDKHPQDEKKPLRKITPHGLRHTLATLLYDGTNGITPKDIQFVLGHKTPRTAMRIYTHVTEKQKKGIKSSINNLNF